MKAKRAAKHVLAVLLGLALLNGFCAWYYNTAPYEHSADRATDTVRRADARVSQAKEGMGAHRIDENGYNNPPERAAQRPLALMLGSSHTEGFNVAPGQDVSSLLSEKLGGPVYNLGMSQHTFHRNAANLARALERFRPTRAVVIETDRVVVTKGQIENAMADEVPRLPDTRLPLPDFIVDQPLSKRLYKQFMNLTRSDPEEEPLDFDDISPSQLQEYEDWLTRWFEQLRDVAQAYGVRLVFWYHPHLVLDLDGNARIDAPENCHAAFRAACERAGVTLVDLSETFLERYAAAHALPHGFANTAMGAGHLNADGHRMAAEALCGAIVGGGEAR